jgi:DNA-directed RNA polymerase specialized sigma24 family protein
MKPTWLKDIQEMLGANDFAAFYRDFRSLAGIVCRTGFKAADFNLSSWNDDAVDDITHEILVKQFDKGLVERLGSQVAVYSDEQWKHYFTVIIRNHLLQNFRRPRFAHHEIDEDAASCDPHSLSDLEADADAHDLLSRLTKRQKHILSGLCKNKTLQEITLDLDTIKKSTVHKEKQLIFSMLRAAALGMQQVNTFVIVLCELLCSAPDVGQ